MLGGIVACWILNGLLPGSSELNLELTASANIAQGLFIESFATCTLIMTVLMLGVGEWARTYLAKVTGDQGRNGNFTV